VPASGGNKESDISVAGLGRESQWPFPLEPKRGSAFRNWPLRHLKRRHIRLMTKTRAAARVSAQLLDGHVRVKI
jgi:hypothetical protein